jgi:MFS transporter, VNT family, synaptic vesicle glycoprotein 2
MDQSSAVQSYSFEYAVTKSGFGKFNYVLMPLAGGLMACAFIELTSVNFVLSIAQCDLNLTSIDKGILSAIGYVGLIVSSHLWGFLADTRGRKATLVPSLVLAFAASFLCSFVRNFWQLVLLRFLNGFL